MKDLIPFIIVGLASGAVYGLAGVGLVLTYKTSGVLNFAHGALATVAAYLFFTLLVSNGWPWPVAVLVCVVVLGPVMGVILEFITRRSSTADSVTQLAATVGLLIAILAVIELVYPESVTRNVPVFLGKSTVDIGANVQWSSIVTILFSIAAAALLSVLFRRYRIGMAMRAVVLRPDLLALIGSDPVRVRRLAWIIGTSFAAATGVLLAPLLPLDPNELTLLVFAAFGAAALGRFASAGMTFAGGLVIGVAASLITEYSPSTGVLSGISPSLPFIVLFGVLLLAPRGFLAAQRDRRREPRPTWAAPGRLQAGAGVLVLAGLCAVPAFAGIHLTDWTIGLAMTILFLSLSLLVRTSGQISLAHITFAAIGAVTCYHLGTAAHLPWGLAVLGAMLVPIPVGMVLAIPASRLSGPYPALATFGFAIVVEYLFYQQGFMFGPASGGLLMPSPDLSWLGTSPEGLYYYLTLVLTVLVAVAVVFLVRTRLGRLLESMADSPVALATGGTSLNVTRILVFCMSASLAGLAGALIAVAQGAVDLSSYSPILSLTYFAAIVIIPGRAPWTALIAGLSLAVIPSYLTGGDVPIYFQLIFGASAVLYAVQPASARHLPARVTQALDRWFRRKAEPDRTSAPTPAPRSPGRAGEALTITDLSIRYSGLVAVDKLSFAAAPGQITGLIGPNGAGKTSTFNAVSGLTRPASGSITLGSQDIRPLPASARARRGLGRTFQIMELFDSQTIRQNVVAGAEAPFAGRNPLWHFLGTKAQRDQVVGATEQALRVCGLEEMADRPVANLSTGQRRLVELARCLAGPHYMLLLDEPSSGLDPAETAAFGAILRRVVAQRGVGVLLVEHDMTLVMDICDVLYVLDFGRLIASGTPAEMRESPVVRAAYLGDSSVPIAPVRPSGSPSSPSEVGS